MNSEPHPYVAAWCRKEQATFLIKLCKEIGIGISNYKIEGYEGIMIYAQSITEMIKFAKELKQNARHFQ